MLKSTRRSIGHLVLFASLSVLLSPWGYAEEGSFQPLRACGTIQRFPQAGLDPSDCSGTLTRPLPKYEPGELLVVPVVVHVLMDDACTAGALSDETVRSQIDILNEDFLALQGTPGASGQNSQIRFELASETPEGQPSSGITRNCNSAWYQNGDDYWLALSWNPSRYLNIYTNTASGARGFNVIPPWLDSGALVGSAEDRIVVNHLVFGRDAAFPPHDQGRTATHEVGHYLGLMHPYFGGCGLPGVPDCYSTGDLICDTPPDAQSHDKCPVGALSCGGFAVPIENYMELTDDLCMTGFTAEQVQRMRCTLLTYRQDLLEAGAIFGDGFESGDLSAWS